MEVPQNSLQSFEEMLVATYPSLFPKDVEGHPIDPCCGIECPTGWENLVLNLCGAIVSYQKSYRYVKTSNKWGLFKYWLYEKVFLKIYNPLIVKIRPSFVYSKEIKNPYPKRTVLALKMNHLSNKLLPNIFVKTYPPTVCIDQIKEKFGSLRFYISGGDRHIRGMIDFAEFLSLRTCQITGKSGVLCRKGSWYQTLSLDKQFEFGYTTVNKDENHAI